MPSEDAEWLRAEMGRDLAARRRAAGLTQAELAALAGYSQAAVAHAETGRDDLGRGFWQAADKSLGTGSFYADAFHLTRDTGGKRTAVTPQDASLRSDPMMKSALPEQARAAYQRRGWPLTTAGDRLTLATGKAADALETGAVAGLIAAQAWHDGNGAESAARALPRLPPYGRSLAAIDAGDRWYFLIAPGACPWTRPARPPGPAGTPAHIRWHSNGSAIPAPPAAARWAHLPPAGIYLPPAHAVLDLLAWAAARVTGPATLTMPGGVNVAPAGHR